MTVYNTSYSSLDEVWADSYLSPNLQKKTKKKRTPPQSDPLCDLYNMGNSHYQENDLISFANKYYEQHEKAKYQKPRMMDDDEPREKSPVYVDVEAEHVRPEFPDEDYAMERDLNAANKAREKDRLYFHTKEYYTNDGDEKTSTFLMYDVILYIISGIILIFMMEQFVRIGTMLS